MSGAKKFDGESNQTLKKDKGKAPISLIPKEFIFGVARVLGFGANKYSKYCWVEGMDWHRLIDSTLRHVLQFESGEDVDEESGESHLLHAACGLMFLYMYQLLGLGKDDRWKRNEEKELPEVSGRKYFNSLGDSLGTRRCIDTKLSSTEMWRSSSEHLQEDSD